MHAEVLAGLDRRALAAVVDPNIETARALAGKWNIPHVYASLDEALSEDRFDRAHVLVPPDHHHATALALLRAGKAVLVEKPLAVSSSDCDDLLHAAAAPALLGVNQNAVHHPAFARLKGQLDHGRLGRLHFVDILYNMPLRQMSTRQFGHWMFQRPLNILLEQAIHPLSQLVNLCGAITAMRAIGTPPEEISPGLQFVAGFTGSFACEGIPASMRFAVGQSFPVWQLRAVCDDGVAFADMTANRFWTLRRTRWLDAIDGAVSGSRTALEIARDSMAGFNDYALSTARLKKRSDAFFRSMAGSIRAFHAAVDKAQTPPLDGRFGRQLVETCERLAVLIAPESGAGAARAAPAYKADGVPDVTVIGGTGFIGTQVVSELVDAGLKVAVLARNTRNLPAVFQSERVELHKGDLRNASAVTGAIAGAGAVVNLAHGGGGDSWEAIRNGMVGGAECVARACLAAGTPRLLHISSIACLYLGPQSAPITGATPPDPQAGRRADYARAKALCEGFLMELHAKDGLPVCILRPGLVVGAGTSPFHSGLGFYNNEQHCIGWNLGRNPLPFVLVEDVASAIIAALRAPHIVGRSYNLVGDVRLTAREYLAALAQALRRPLQFHPKFPAALYLEDLGKWSIKALTGRRAPLPSLRDIRSRGLMAKFDCSNTKRDLGWNPVSDRDVFIARAIGTQI